MNKQNFFVYRVSSECYDKAWLVTAINSKKAIETIKDYTESLGWHLSYPGEKRAWNVERVLDRNGIVWETQDI